MKLRRTIFGLTGLALLLVVLAFQRPEQNSALAPPIARGDQPVIRLVRNPEPAPEFTVQDVEGNPLSPADFHGKVVLITFWATWCGPCREEVADLIDLQDRYGDKLQVIGLSVDEGPTESVRHFVRARRINYRVAIVPNALQDKFGGVHGLPTMFLLDTSGRIVQRHVGLRDPQLYDREIRALLGMPVDARVETFEDNGQIFLRNAGRSTEFPGLDLSKLTPEQKKAAIRRLNEEICNCGCTLTLAQCRFNDTNCEVSLGRGKQVVTAAGAGKLEPPGAPSQQ